MSLPSSAMPVSVVALRGQPQRVSHDILIGKDVLELVTGAMYVDPLTIYREYIQNAADAIDEARQDGLFRGTAGARVDISFDHAERVARIRDNGAGVPGNDFTKRLTAIGASVKRGTRQRGFRGVGRLAGLGYAQEVVFRSRSVSDSKVHELLWNGRKLRECLRTGGFTGDLAEVVREVTEVSTLSGTGWPPHFFEVELRKVARVRNDLLMNPDEIRGYVAQVSPVPYSPSFRFKSQIEETLRRHEISPGIDIFVDSGITPVYRSFADQLKLSEKLTDQYREIEFFEIPGVEGGTDAIGFLLHHSYYGAVPKNAGVAGLRVRSGNIQVGGPAIFESLFSESRFNSWCVGEVHVLANRIILNGRRDDFEINVHYQNLQGHLAAVASRISKLCRERSILRNRMREAHALYMDASERLQVIRDSHTPTLVRRHYRESILGAIARLEHLRLHSANFSDEERSLIAERMSMLRREIEKAKGIRRGRRLQLFPQRKQRAFLEFLGLMLDACDAPQEGAALAKKIIDQARRSRNR